MRKPVQSSASRPRGRPRNEVARRAMLEAARALLEEGGPGAVTMEAVAERAGVGKPTVYRWWPDRLAITMAALMDADVAVEAASRKRRALARLREQLHAIAARFATSTGRYIASMIAAADPESELAKAFRGHFVLARRVEGRVLLQEAIANGELGASVDVEVALDVLYGAIFFRLMMGHAPLDAAFVDAAFDTVMGIKSSPLRRASRKRRR